MKKRLIKEKILPEVCVGCGQLPLWHGKKLVLILDHINGIHDDNRLENLRLLCPNCNSQTDTFAGKQLRKNVVCATCGIGIGNGSTHCKRHARKKRKCVRPDLHVLQQDVREIGFSGTGKKYGVSDNAVRKWLRRVSIDP